MNTKKKQQKVSNLCIFYWQYISLLHFFSPRHVSREDLILNRGKRFRGGIF